MYGRPYLQQPLASELNDESQGRSTGSFHTFPASVRRWEDSIGAVQHFLDNFGFGDFTYPPPIVERVVMDVEVELVGKLDQCCFGRVNRLLDNHKAGWSWRVGPRCERRPELSPRRLIDAG